MDPTKVRPRDGWAVVLADARPAKKGVLYLPSAETGVEKVTEGAGLVIRLGPGEKNHRLGLEVGQRILYRGYLKHANPIETDEKWPNGQNKTYFIMSSEDIMGIIAPGIEVGVFSGRPEVPHME